MGQKFSSMREYFFSKPEKIVLLYGLADVGKTAVFNKMQLDCQIYPMPMPDFCEGWVNLKHFKFHLCDIARRLTARYSGNYFVQKCDAVILVVDSTDPESIGEINEILTHMLLNEILKNAIFLVFANKQDLSNALDPSQIAEKMKLKERSGIFHIQGTSGFTGDGVLEGLEYLHSMFYKNKWYNIF